MNESRRRSGTEGQVIPLEEADKVLELCSPIGLIACVCRKGARAIDERNELEYTCMGMGVGMLKWERWPERYKGGVKFVTVEEAKEWNHRMDKRGFVHLLMLAGAPYIGGFCQCDYPDCAAIRRVVDFGGAGAFGAIGTLKSHHVAQVDYDECNGCGICVQRCQFGALKFEVTSQKANIDQFKCYGCGLCQTGCPRGAIKLLERKSLPALVEVW
ncbi:MAG: 4Fe-4S binding protein [Chloroflexi bacterium]|nr:4Fe-4S binding protein [Chloroflexota bacterium]